MAWAQSNLISKSNSLPTAAAASDFSKKSQIRNVSIIRSRKAPQPNQSAIGSDRFTTPNTPRQIISASTLNSIRNNPARLIARQVKVTTVSGGILSWSMTLWFFVQLPFAVLSLIMFGLMEAMDSIASLFAKENEVSGGVGSWLFYKATAVAGWVAEKALAGIKFLTGIDLNLISMADGLFITFFTIVFAVGFITLLAASFIYIMSNIRPLSGSGAGIKIGLFILAMIGYMVPIINLLPWHLPWMAAVWKYPR